MRINEEKLANNKNLKNDLDALNKYIYPFDTSKLDEKELEIYNHRKMHIYDGAYYRELKDDISIIVCPNNTHIHNLTNKRSLDYFKRFPDYAINVYYRGVLFADYSGYENILHVDRLLDKDPFMDDIVLPQIIDYIPTKDFKIWCSSYYIDHGDRPFIVDNPT